MRQDLCADVHRYDEQLAWVPPEAGDFVFQPIRLKTIWKELYTISISFPMALFDKLI